MVVAKTISWLTNQKACLAPNQFRHGALNALKNETDHLTLNYLCMARSIQSRCAPTIDQDFRDTPMYHSLRHCNLNNNSFPLTWKLHTQARSLAASPRSRHAQQQEAH
mmetsp:Transcript_107430/g.213301  ORF Transcript_107430/g.213301 Transcript_107430/m.213301 type:complete len:108 (+) Transcript_107430:149-472(+)